MKLFRRSIRALIGIADAPFYMLEEKERKRKLNERLKRLEQKR